MTTKAQILNTQYSARGCLTADSRAIMFKPLPYNEIHNTKHDSRNCALHLSRELYKSTLILTNKPNFQNAEMMITLYITRGYERIRPMDNCQNKPNSNPISQIENRASNHENPESRIQYPAWQPILLYL